MLNAEIKKEIIFFMLSLYLQLINYKHEKIRLLPVIKATTYIIMLK